MSIDLPLVHYAEGEPKLSRQVSEAGAGDRIVARVEVADPVWVMRMRTGPLSRADRKLMQAFLDQASDGMTTVVYLGAAVLEPPAAYLADPANAALTNTGNLVSVTNGIDVVVNSVTNGLDIRPGDFVGFESGAYYALGRVRYGGGAVAAGSSISLGLASPLPGYIVASALVRWTALRLSTRVRPKSVEFPDDWAPIVSFDLAEVPK